MSISSSLSPRQGDTRLCAEENITPLCDHTYRLEQLHGVTIAALSVAAHSPLGKPSSTKLHFSRLGALICLAAHPQHPLHYRSAMSTAQFSIPLYRANALALGGLVVQ